MASDTKQPAIIGQFGIVSLTGLEPFLPDEVSEPQSIVPAVDMFLASWALAGCTIAASQFGDIAMATPWPRKPSNAPISKARWINRFTMTHA
ncbi:MAG: hypothetical protein ABIU18_02630 [Novosphingobium sp.]